MNESFQEESLFPGIDEAMPLLRQHWEEIAHYKDIPLDPDIERYVLMAEQGRLKIYSTRVDGALVGYAAFIVSSNAHYKESLQAVQDILYIDPNYRKGSLGLRLIRFAEKELAEAGVQVVYHHCKLAHPALGKVLERVGYEAVETVFSKRLDKRSD